MFYVLMVLNCTLKDKLNKLELNYMVLQIYPEQLK